MNANQAPATKPRKASSSPHKEKLDASATYTVGNMSFIVCPVFKVDSAETIDNILVRLLRCDAEIP